MKNDGTPSVNVKIAEAVSYNFKFFMTIENKIFSVTFTEEIRETLSTDHENIH